MNSQPMSKLEMDLYEIVFKSCPVSILSIVRGPTL